jgi:hypothetical protein
MKVSKRQLRRLIREEKRKLSELHDPLDPFAKQNPIDKLDYALQLIEKHQKEMPETSPDLAIAIGMLNELWEDLHPEV